MKKITTIAFDMGGVIITIDQQRAARRFGELGLPDAEKALDPYTQKGIFGDIEEGKISAEEFRADLSRLCGKELSYDDCRYGWTGYAADVPLRNLDCLRRLREQGYRLLLLSNTNPYMMSWVFSSDFVGGRSLKEYFDTCYCSYEMGMMKPNPKIFEKLLSDEGLEPEEVLFLDDGPRNIECAASLGIQTLLTINGEDWTAELQKRLEKDC